MNGTWSSPMPLVQHRFCHSATLLRDGSVLIVGGGRREDGQSGVCDLKDRGSLNSVARFDPRGDTFELVAALTDHREAHEAVRLSDGSAVVIGGMLDIG